MTTRDDSRKIDQAIRDAVAFGGLPLTGRFEAAFAAVLELHTPKPIDSDQPNGPQYCPSCIDEREPFADYPCPTIRAIAHELRVSSQDTPPAPRPPRVWVEDDPEPDPYPTVVEPSDGRQRVYSEDWGGWALQNEPGGGVEQWDELPKPLTEVLPSVSTVTDGR